MNPTMARPSFELDTAVVAAASAADLLVVPHSRAHSRPGSTNLSVLPATRSVTALVPDD